MSSKTMLFVAMIPLVVWALTEVRPALAQASPMEWTMEQAYKHWKPMVRPVQHVGIPGYQFQTGVMWDGSLLFGPLAFLELKVMQEEMAPLGEHLLHVSVAYGDPARFIDRKGTNNPLIRRRLEDGRLPIPYVQTTDGELEWTERVYADLLGRKASDGVKPTSDDTLVTHARFSVKNHGYAKQTAHLWLHFGTTASIQLGYKATQKPDLAPAIEHHLEDHFGMVGDQVRYVLPQPSMGKIIWHDEIPAPVGTSVPGQRVVEWRIPLAPGEQADLDLRIPYGLVTKEKARQILALDEAQGFERICEFWTHLQYGPGQITTPDPFINDYLIAVAGQMAEQVACRYRTGVWMYKTSPNHYEGYWPCNAAKALPTLDYRGLTDLNTRVLNAFVQKQSDDVRGMEKGAMGHNQNLAGEGYARIHGFLGDFGEWTANPLLLSHGLAMWSLGAHYRITRDRKWLGEGPHSPLQAMLDGFDWVTKQRQRTMREVDGKKVDHWGLLPAASAHDWLAGNTIFNDAFCIYGMAEVVRVLTEIHHPRAAETLKELNDYRRCLRDRYQEATNRARRLPLPDGSTIPFVPRMVQELDWAKPDWTYTGYGPLRAGAWGALDPEDPLVKQSLAYLEAGMPAGEGAEFSGLSQNADIADANFADISDPSAERHYLWRNYVEYETMWPIGGPLFLAQDDLPRFFEFLFNNLAIVLHHDWRVGVESLDGVPSCAPGDGERWQIIRRMFVNERDIFEKPEQSLWLLQAIPRSWLRPGDSMSVRDMGTQFGGKVNLDVNVADDGDTLTVHAVLSDLAVAPEEIRMRLRSGDGRPLKAATINGKSVPVSDDDTIELPKATSGDYRIEGKFDG